ncbi:MAG: PepSY-like domain-containing protein [Flavobacteriales bacterium]|nr:PepSY-like domain-containing protein [Flavobacteriales bacterium]MCB9194162.1 PepSY-like domain-containing protein [Flavobacteriales bacterium]
MSTIHFPIALLGLALMTSAQAQDPATLTVPNAVRAAFSQRYARATDPSWEKEKDGTWSVEFTDAAAGALEAVYATDGQWLHTAYGITRDELPASVNAELQGRFTKYVLHDAERLEMPDGTMRYAVELEDPDHELLKLTFDASGAVKERTYQSADTDNGDR